MSDISFRKPAPPLAKDKCWHCLIKPKLKNLDWISFQVMRHQTPKIRRSEETEMPASKKRSYPAHQDRPRSI